LKGQTKFPACRPNARTALLAPATAKALALAMVGLRCGLIEGVLLLVNRISLLPQ
jgi:hypothetical protein